MSTSVAAARAPGAAGLVHLLDVIHDVGTSAIIELNRAHFSVLRIEEAGGGTPAAPPSDRWYRLYEQMAYRALQDASLDAGSNLNTLAAGVLYSEIADLESRAADLERHPARAGVRVQVAEAVSFARDVANALLESAIALLAGVRNGGSARRRLGAYRRTSGTGALDVAGSAGLAQLLRAQLATAVVVFSQMFLIDGDRAGGARRQASAAPERAVSTLNVVSEDEPATITPPADLGAELRAARGEADLEALARAARTGDARALDTLLRAIQGQVVRYCRAKLLGTVSMQTADDVAQDVLYAVCSALPRYQPAGSVMAFVLGVARFKVVDAFRAGGRDRSIPMDSVPDRPDNDDGPEVIAVRRTEIVRLQAALAQLPEHHREVIVLRIALSYSAEEVAGLLGTTAGAVRVTQHRAMVKLRGLLTET